jgi:hypothetical protein
MAPGVLAPVAGMRRGHSRWDAALGCWDLRHFRRPRSPGSIAYVDRAAVVETHISVLVFYGDRVYKVRKSVRTAFLDFSTRELRLADCRREVELNRRLAPDVYLGVDDVVDESGVAVDHLVVMRRLPAERRLATMVEDPGFPTEHLVRVARRLAAFHERAERSREIDASGSAEHLTMLWSSNLSEVAPFDHLVDASLLERIGERALAYLAGRSHLFAERVTRGRIIDGHGDLLAQDIFCLDDGPRILDCVEFDPLFRWGDVLYDTAFLAMDLEHLGRPDLSDVFLRAYREFTAETHPASLEHWYIAYRALVRAKISCLRAEGGDEPAAAEARAFARQSAEHLASAAVHLVVVGGLPGSGKTTVATGLAQRFGWTLMRSDEMRKDLAGLAHDTHAYAPPFEGLYSPATSRIVYDRLLERAGVALRMGESVVLDASWLDPAMRQEAADLARRASATFDELCCVVAVRESEARIRARGTSDASDATPQVLSALASRAEVPWPGAVVVDTGRPPVVSVEVACAAVRPGPQAVDV